MAEDDHHKVTGWVLAGGEGRRMSGRDKGLIMWKGQPLAWQVAHRLRPQVDALWINANRHLDAYQTWGWPVAPDEADLPRAGGPLTGILTALRRVHHPWLMIAPCDSPMLPADMVARLLRQATQCDADIAVPVTGPGGDGLPMHHWTTILVHRRTQTRLEDAFAAGERRVRAWVAMNTWIGVSFDGSADFMNINTPEALHGTP